MPAPAAPVAIAPATAADLDAIDEIERHSFGTPWPRATFEAELARPHARLEVARTTGPNPGRIAGFCNYWLVIDEVHIHAIATHPDHRRRGIGAHLVAHALSSGRALHCTTASLEVRRTNTPAIAMYERAGFRTVHIRPRYYQDDGTDALIMVLALSTG
jgi:ribosomal-protein-alanine N-acetyltransferase